jgi:hypothetical protein
MSQDEAFEVGKVMLLQYQWPTIMCAIVPNPVCVLSCLVLSCLVLSCLVLSCLVLSCLVVSCLVLSCLVLLYQNASTTTTAATSSV